MSTITFTGDATVVVGGVANFLLSPDAVLTGGPLDVTHGQPAGVFAPTSVSWAASSAAKAFTWTAPNVVGIYTIYPFGPLPAPWVVSPTTLNITVLAAGSPPTHRTEFPLSFGVPPFGVFTPRDILPAASMPIVPPTVTNYGTLEAGGGTITGLHADDGYTFIPPLVLRERAEWNMNITAQGTGPFDIDYMFTPDGGVTWYVGKQAAATVITVDGDGQTTYTYEVNKVFPLGFSFRFDAFNTGNVPINIQWQNRLTSPGP